MSYAGEDLLWSAVSEAVASVAHLELEWDSNKLEKKIRDHFKKAVKGLEFGMKPWHVLVNDYADAVFSALFNGLSDRGWLHQIDFLLVLDAAIKENFPSRLLSAVPQQAFERTVLCAHDRAFDEQRYLPILWEAIQCLVQGNKSRNKVYHAAEAGRKLAIAADAELTGTTQTFTQRFVDASIGHLSEQTKGEPERVLEEDTAVRLFESVVDNGGLPTAYTADAHGLARDLQFIKVAVRMAYSRHSTVAAEWAARAESKKGKGGKGIIGEGYTPAFTTFSAFDGAGGKGIIEEGLGEEDQGVDGSWGEIQPDRPAPPAKRWKGGVSYSI